MVNSKLPMLSASQRLSNSFAINAGRNSAVILLLKYSLELITSDLTNSTAVTNIEDTLNQP
jgi:hypothetical protein